MNKPLSEAAVGQAFPHKALKPLDVYPPITLELAAEFLGAMRDYCERHPESPYAEHQPAIVFGLFKGPLTKYLCSADEVQDTIANLRKP